MFGDSGDPYLEAYYERAVYVERLTAELHGKPSCCSLFESNISSIARE